MPTRFTTRFVLFFGLLGVCCLSLLGGAQEDKKDVPGKAPPSAPGVGATAATEGTNPAALKHAAKADANGAVFDTSDQYVPPSKLPVNQAPTARLAKGDTAKAASYYEGDSITPEGKRTKLPVPDEDAKGFEKMLKGLEPRADATGEEEPVLRPESVIGTDTRVQITATTSYPYRTAGRIDIGCTGTLIGPRHVLTAGHCVYNIDTDQWYSQLNFSAGQNGATRPYGTATWKRAIAPTGWTRDHSRDHDFALIVLNQDVGTTVGTMSFGYNDSLPAHNININGYPGDKPTGTMWHSFGKLTQIQPFRLYHDADTFGGNSGSGVYVYTAADNRRVIYGIHAYGVDSTGFNGATRINKTVYDTLRRWISEN